MFSSSPTFCKLVRARGLTHKQKVPLVTNAEITAPNADQATPAAIEPPSPLIRGVGLAGATTLNMIDMIGVGPFITIPLIIAAILIFVGLIIYFVRARARGEWPFRNGSTERVTG